MKHILEKIGREQPEQRRAKQDTDDDFADCGRLADALRQHPADAGGQHNQGQLQQGKKQQRLGLVDREGVDGRAQIMPPLTEIIWPLI